MTKAVDEHRVRQQREGPRSSIGLGSVRESNRLLRFALEVSHWYWPGLSGRHARPGILLLTLCYFSNNRLN